SLTSIARGLPVRKNGEAPRAYPPSPEPSGDPALEEIEARRSAAGVLDVDVHVLLVAVVVVAQPRALHLRDLHGPGGGAVRTGGGRWNRIGEVSQHRAPGRVVPLEVRGGARRQRGDTADLLGVDGSHQKSSRFCEGSSGEPGGLGGKQRPLILSRTR